MSARPGSKRKAIVAALVVMPMLVAAGAAPPEPDASLQSTDAAFDDTTASVFEADIEWLAATGITEGCNPPDNSLFCPDDSVTRGQMAAFLHRALPDLPVGAEVKFTDDDASVFESDIEWLAATGVTKGCSDTEFCPNDPVSRDQMAAFLHRALVGQLTVGDGVDFADDDDSVFEADIEWLAATGVTKGCSDTEFCPNDPVSRSQMAAFLHRALDQVLPDAPSGSLQDADSGAGTAKDFTTDGGGEQSDVGTPPDGGGLGIPALPTAGDIPVVVAAAAPSDWAADQSTVATPGPVADASEIANTGDLALLQAIAGGFDDQEGEGYCPNPSFLYWGFNCAGQPVYNYNADWLLYNNLPYHVGQIAPVGCTGTLIGRNVVLTAAHCVYDQASFVFVPDLYGGMGVGTYANVGNAGNYWTGSRRIYHAEFLESGAGFAAFDYALIVLDANGSGQHAGDVYGWTNVFNLGAASTNLTQGYYNWNAERHMYGYPQEGWWAGLGTGPYQNQNYDAVPWWCGTNEGQYYNLGAGYYALGFGCITNGGNSGGPIYQRIDGQLRLVSVLSTGGFAIHCEYYGVTGCGVRPDFGTSYYMLNSWGSPLLNTTGAYGFDDLLWVAYNTALDGAVCTGPCP